MLYKRYLITKHDPNFVDEFGTYTKDEWNSIDDIGKIYDGIVFTPEMYVETENRYADVLRFLMNEKGVSRFIVMGLEKCNCNNSNFVFYTALQSELKKNICEGMSLTKDMAIEVLRLCLRGDIFCHVYSPDNHFVFETEGDFYFSVTCEELKKNEISTIKQLGLKEVFECKM